MSSLFSLCLNCSCISATLLSGSSSATDCESWPMQPNPLRSPPSSAIAALPVEWMMVRLRSRRGEKEDGEQTISSSQQSASSTSATQVE